jgi:ParB/RepB/Spo0J family partition protein
MPDSSPNMPANDTVWIDLSLIDLPPFAREHSSDKLEELVESMKNNQQLQEIVVTPAGPRFEVLAGAGRVLAARKLGWQKIRANVRQRLSEFEKLMVAVTENDEREEPSPFFRAELYGRMMETDHIDQAELARRLKKDKSLIGKYLTLRELAPELKEKWNAFHFSLSQLLQIKRFDTPEDQLAAAKEVADKGLSDEALKSWVDKKLCVKGSHSRKSGNPETTAELDPSLRGDDVNGLTTPQHSSAHPASLQPASPQEPAPEAWSIARFTRDIDGTINVETHIDPRDIDGYFGMIREELYEWLQTKEGSTFSKVWLPETPEEMAEFRALAEKSPGPNALFARVYGEGTYRGQIMMGVTWDAWLNHPPCCPLKTPSQYADALLRVTRMFDLPKWDRRYISPLKATPQASTSQVSAPEGYFKGNGSDKGHG